MYPQWKTCPVPTLQRFSASECRSKFPVAADADGAIMKAYGAVMPVFSSYASRTSYVIAPDGKSCTATAA